MKILTASAMKIAEGAAVAQGGSYLELMEQAGAGAAEGILTLVDPAERETLILCGKGNNGGDGVACARMLHEAGVKVRAFLVEYCLNMMIRAISFIYGSPDIHLRYIN